MTANFIPVIWINYYINTIILRIILLIKKSINTDYSALTEKFETDPIVPMFKVNDKARITKLRNDRMIKYKNIFSKDYTGDWSKEIFIVDSVLKTNSWTYKTKIFKRRKNNRKFL